MTKKVFIRTLGCQMNDRDSEVIAGLLTKAGYKLADDEKDADIVIFNTCSVRQHAEDKVWSEVGRLVKSKRKRQKSKTQGKSQKEETEEKKIIIGIVGCMAQHYKEGVFARSPAVDFVVGPADIEKIPKILNDIIRENKGNIRDDKGRIRENKGGIGENNKGRDGRGGSLLELKIWETDGTGRPEEIYHTGFYEDKRHAYVVISEGCSNHCSYCVVPNVRGELHNRDYKDIIREIEKAAGKGITKITLLGQNVNAYVSKSKTENQKSKIKTKIQDPEEEIDFIKLLGLINGIKGIEEFSFITSHPKDTSVELFKAMAGLDKLKKSLHLPVQSGSNRILGLMNRGYTIENYLTLVKEYRRIVPGGLLSTDIIVGFPTESEKEFIETHKVIREIEFDSAYIFKYSPRPNTEAEKLPDDVPQKEKKRRHKALLDYQKGLHDKRAI